MYIVTCLNGAVKQEIEVDSLSDMYDLENEGLKVIDYKWIE